MSESRLDLPNIDTALFQQPDTEHLFAPARATHAPRFLLLYGSLRERSFSRLAAEEAARIFGNVLQNKATRAQRDCVLINASFAIQALEPQKKIEECVALAKESLESGKALATLHKFLTLNQ